MAEKEKKEAKVTANLTQESIKTMSESVGITGLPDEAASRLAVDTTYKLKQIIQVRICNMLVSDMKIHQKGTFDILYLILISAVNILTLVYSSVTSKYCLRAS